jgi:hypothetical protein
MTLFYKFGFEEKELGQQRWEVGFNLARVHVSY